MNFIFQEYGNLSFGKIDGFYTLTKCHGVGENMTGNYLYQKTGSAKAKKSSGPSIPQQLSSGTVDFGILSKCNTYLLSSTLRPRRSGKIVEKICPSVI